jgi:alkanesulfonate monooxygenase SsuD/methylene tetrahydromethanopterin reductase-like flavin-dependent oxidoreductase (luciferase family)
VLAAALAAGGAHAEGEHARRLGAEIVVSLGDVARLAERATPELHKQGLGQRLAGAFTGLALLVRRARQENPRLAPSPDWLGGLRRRLAAGDLGALKARLQALERLYRLDLSTILPAPPTVARRRFAAEVDEGICAACHQSPDLDTALPAFDLFAQAAATDRREFAARLISGIRGDALLALQNPFSDEEIAALVAFYGAGRR